MAKTDKKTDTKKSEVSAPAAPAAPPIDWEGRARAAEDALEKATSKLDEILDVATRRGRTDIITICNRVDG